jgi:hypothetical protein
MAYYQYDQQKAMFDLSAGSINNSAFFHYNSGRQHQEFEEGKVI